MIRSATVTTPNCQIAVQDAPGEAGLPTLVFLHGSGFSSAVFAEQMSSDVLAGHRRIGIDFPGHGASGRSSHPGKTYSFAGLSDVVSAALEALELKDVILVGWSLGGHTALEMLDSETRVSGALISGTPPLTKSPIATLRSLHYSRDMLLAFKPRFTRSDAERFERLCLGPAADGRFVETMIGVDENVRPSLARTIMLGRYADQRQYALQATKPLCIVQGEADPIVRSSSVKELIDDPAFDGTGHMLPGVGHAPFFECPDRFDAILADFAATVTGREPVERPQRGARGRAAA